MTKKNIVWVSSEVHPYAKTGGLADVVASLSLQQSKMGHNVSVIMPFYRQQIADLNIKFNKKYDLLEVPFGFHTEWAQVLEHRVNKNLKFYFIEFDRFFDRPTLYDYNGSEYSDNGQRYIFFSRAAMETVKLLNIKADILHTNDWHSALCCVYLKSDLYSHLPQFKKCRSVLTIHNIGYQGRIDKSNMYWTNLGWEYFNFQCLEYYDCINLLKGGILTADMVNAVSPTYADEILSSEFSFGLDGPLRHCASRGKLRGIINGIDIERWDPTSDELIEANFSYRTITKGKAKCKADLQKDFNLPIRADIPLFGTISRLADQKGLDVLAKCLEKMLANNDIQFVLLGDGDDYLEKYFQYLRDRFPAKVGVYLGYNDKLAHEIEAGCDMFLMPSRYEPCGLNQMYSMRYGTVPIVRATGGLEDTVNCYSVEKISKATGFKFYDLHLNALRNTIEWACEVYLNKPKDFRKMQINGMKEDFSWQHTAKLYELLYEDANRTI
ncbi:glycogen synthase GlgA [Lentisphaerota bacterium WC36G]|nr:glycogen synthase GlgA [Lentisphaerae bacterium WC36]